MAISGYTQAPKELGQVPDVTGSINRGFALYRQGEKERAAEKAKGEADFLKLAKVDPVFTRNAALQKMQLEHIKQYQKSLGDEYFNSGNKPDLDAQIRIQNLSTALVGTQMAIKNAEKEYEKLDAMKKADPLGDKFNQKKLDEGLGLYTNALDNQDPSKFINFKADDYMKIASVENPEKWLEKNVPEGKKVGTLRTEGGKTFKDEKMVYNGDSPEVAKQSSLALLKEPKWEARLLDDFEALPVKEQQAYHDKFQDNPKEMLAQLAIDKYPKWFSQRDLSSEQLRPRMGKSSGSGSEEEPYTAPSGKAVSTIPITASGKTKSPIKVGDVIINNEEDYQRILGKPGKKRTLNENDAVIKWNKSTPDDVETQVPWWSEKRVYGVPGISVDNNNSIDLSTGKIDNTSTGVKGYTKPYFKLMPFNVKENRLATIDESGEDFEGSEKDGIVNRWVMIGKTSDDKDGSGKIATIADVKAVHEAAVKAKKKFNADPIIQGIQEADKKVKSPSQAKTSPKKDSLGIL